MSLRIRLLITVVLIIFLFCLNLLSLEFYLYWTYEWLDSAMHLLGGFLVGNTALIAGQLLSKKRPFLWALVGGLVVGIVWEVVEYELGISQWGVNFVMDTGLDLAMDIIGVLAAYVVWLKIPLPSSLHKKENE